MGAPPLPSVDDAEGVTRYGLVPFCDQVLNRELAWQGVPETSKKLFVLLAVAHVRIGYLMVDKVRGEVLISFNQEVALVEVLKRTTNKVCFASIRFRHCQITLPLFERD